jgi:hypothetical protein
MRVAAEGVTSSLSSASVNFSLTASNFVAAYQAVLSTNPFARFHICDVLLPSKRKIGVRLE